MHRLMRRDALCPKPHNCAEAQMESADDDDIGPCAACPLELLNRTLASGVWRVVSTLVDVDFALQVGIRVDLERLTYLEFALLRIFTEERKRFENEESKKQHGR
jgi:hypothetical protein